MPRFGRIVAPGSVQHVIARFVQRDFLMDLPGAREEYLRRLPCALKENGWKVIAYALMSSHVHLATIAGPTPMDRVLRSLHTGFAGWLNRKHNRLGPVFADRPRSIIFEGETVGALLAYIHNNPVRAGIADNPWESDWTSHRCYIGMNAPPSWLHVCTGLRFAGFDDDMVGRQMFNEFVQVRAAQPRSPMLSGLDQERRRVEHRQRRRAPVELMSSTVSRIDHVLQAEAQDRDDPHLPMYRQQCCDPLAFIEKVAAATGVSAWEMRSKIRSRHIVRARRVALVAWTQYEGFPMTHIARALGLASSSASELVRSADLACTLLAANVVRR